jgi:hypothetical protein
MQCLHCGWCCKHLAVVIVNDPKKGIAEDNLEMHDGQGNSCKHLRGEKVGEYYCAIHNEIWYNETPCAKHTQFEYRDSPCRIGAALLAKLKKV